jgi:PEP-CTERM motif
MRPLSTICKAFVLLLLAAGTARAVPILDVTSSLSLSDPTQMGRLSRNGVPQDWVGSEPFPGVINASTAYHYTTFSVNVGITPFIQIEFDANFPNTFVSAYLESYDPTSEATIATTWLGDAGFSGPLFGFDSVFFQVFVPANQNLVVVVNNTNSLGIGDPFRVLVEGFIDTQYTDPAAPVPEPDTLLLSGGGLLLLAVGRFVRQA